MEQYRGILLNVWREACRHIELAESILTIGRILQEHLPPGRLRIIHFNPADGTLETLAAYPADDPEPRPQRARLSRGEMAALRRWCEVGRVAPLPTARGGVASSLPAALREAAAAEGQGALICPLRTGEGALGALVLTLDAPGPPQERHRELLTALLEPLAIAMENDLRLRELRALREAAESDKGALLRRLGRRDLSDTIVGADQGLRRVMARVEQVAPSDLPVLIFGETGTGKELVARAIHQRSARHAGPVLRVNCGAIPPELIDSQLFGHERGAFTGATDARRGWFERADRGTLFLDEIGELPLAAQSRLLRILQDGWLERVGGQRPIQVDVRIVAATHRDLAGMVGTGAFREDLWYRLAVFPIYLPPLRERHDDIEALARHFAQRAAIRFGLPPLELRPGDLELLLAYDWPGTVRELATVIDRAAILGDGRGLDVAGAMGVGQRPPRAASAGAAGGGVQPPGVGHGDGFTSPGGPDSSAGDPAARAGGLDSAGAGTGGFPAPGAGAGGFPPAGAGEAGFLSLEEATRRHIEAALARTAGRVDGPFGAARLLGLNPNTLRSKMRKAGIDAQRFRPTPPRD